MASDRNTTLTHVYGLTGLIPGALSIIYLVQAGASWREYFLVGSGWLAALFYAWMLLKAFALARDDGERIGNLTAEVQDLRKEIANRNATLDYIAGLQIGRTATPRSIPTNPVEEEAKQ